MNKETENAYSEAAEARLVDRLFERMARKIIDRLAEDVSPGTWQRIIDYAGERFSGATTGTGERGTPSEPESTPAATSGPVEAPASDSAAEPARSRRTRSQHRSKTTRADASAKNATRPVQPNGAAPAADQPASATAQPTRSTAGGAELLNVHEFAAHAGFGSAQTVRNRVRHAHLVGWKDDKGAFRLPADQLNRQKNRLRGLDAVIAILGNGRDAWEWLTTPDRETGRTPLEDLRAGRYRAVEDAAQRAKGRTAEV